MRDVDFSKSRFASKIGAILTGVATFLSLVNAGEAGAVALEEEGKHAIVATPRDSHYGAVTITGSGVIPTSKPSERSISEAREDGYSIDSTVNGNSFTQIITIDGPSSPDTYVFDFDLPQGFSLEQAPDGGAFFRAGDGEIAGRIRAPWAIDAQGKQVDTHFEIQDGQLVQKVNLSPNLQYPVTADPDGIWGWTKCVAAVTAAIAVPAGAVLKLAKFVKVIGNVKEAIQLLTGATTNAEKLQGALAAAGATATELLGIAAIQDNC